MILRKVLVKNLSLHLGLQSWLPYLHNFLHLSPNSMLARSTSSHSPEKQTPSLLLKICLHSSCTNTPGQTYSLSSLRVQISSSFKDQLKLQVFNTSIFQQVLFLSSPPARSLLLHNLPHSFRLFPQLVHTCLSYILRQLVIEVKNPSSPSSMPNRV